MVVDRGQVRYLIPFLGCVKHKGNLPNITIVTWWLKARIAEQEETSIARPQQPKQPTTAKRQLRKHGPAAMNTPATMEELLENRHTTIEKPWVQRFLCGPCRGCIRGANWSFQTVSSETDGQTSRNWQWVLAYDSEWRPVVARRG
jgi:hypothetical protein